MYVSFHSLLIILKSSILTFLYFIFFIFFSALAIEPKAFNCEASVSHVSCFACSSSVNTDSLEPVLGNSLLLGKLLGLKLFIKEDFHHSKKNVALEHKFYK